MAVSVFAHAGRTEKKKDGEAVRARGPGRIGELKAATDAGNGRILSHDFLLAAWLRGRAFGTCAAGEALSHQLQRQPELLGQYLGHVLAV